MSLDNTASECVCYLHCNFCNTTLAVNVPSNIMYNVVTVKCGHCSNLLSLNTGAVIQTTTTTNSHHHPPNIHKQSLFYKDLRENSQSFKSNEVFVSGSSSENERTKALSVNAMGKRQRAPSAYNKFIKEEIRRIKTDNPNISHREAFSTAAKNWAHLPHTQFGLTVNGDKKKDKMQAIGT